eukprot:scaffold3625_cov179-Ochromonas_danica.AAC.2
MASPPSALFENFKTRTPAFCSDDVHTSHAYYFPSARFRFSSALCGVVWCGPVWPGVKHKSSDLRV